MQRMGRRSLTDGVAAEPEARGSPGRRKAGRRLDFDEDPGTALPKRDSNGESRKQSRITCLTDK
jgi:hypothetical protein